MNNQLKIPKLRILNVFGVSAIIIFALFAVFLTHAASAFTPCNCVVIRMDDVQIGWLDNVQAAILNNFTAGNTPLSPALIMGTFPNNPPSPGSSVVFDALQRGYGSGNGPFELTVHGLNHVRYSQLSLSQQVSDLQIANQRMQTLFGFASTIFVPPYNDFNADTLNAMSQTGYKIISSGYDSYPTINLNDPPSLNVDSYGVIHIPFSAYFANGSHVLKISQIENAVQSSITARGYAVLLFHPQDFNLKNNDTIDQQRLAQLNSLVSWMKYTQHYSIVDFQTVADWPSTHP